jgi:4'-phosphopantetheinyl transferase
LAAATAPALSPGDVHLWRCTLDLAPKDRDRLGLLLSREEREKVARLRFARDRDRATASRGWLRRLAAAYVGISPYELAIGRGAYGKPQLPEAPPRDWLCFNVSDSQSVAVYAFARGREVGVDVERVREDFEHEELAERFFAAGERESLFSIPQAERSRAFFRFWTVKEAYVKARGDGLAIAPETFAITFEGGEAARLEEAPEGARPDELERWSFRTFEPAEGFVGAVAVERRAKTGVGAAGPDLAIVVSRFEGALPS